MTSLTFEVKACTDVTIVLSEYPGVEYFMYSYVVLLGGNGNTITRISEAYHQHTVATPDILSCDEHRLFWLSWANNEVEIV